MSKCFEKNSLLSMEFEKIVVLKSNVKAPINYNILKIDNAIQIVLEMKLLWLKLKNININEKYVIFF